MEIGDLVKMKYAQFWMLKGTGLKYHELPVMVIEKSNNAIKVLYPNGKISAALADQYEVLSEID